jgi:hypothetical protein
MPVITNNPLFQKFVLFDNNVASVEGKSHKCNHIADNFLNIAKIKESKGRRPLDGNEAKSIVRL